MAKISINKADDLMFKLSAKFPEKDIQWRVQRLTKD